MDCRAECVARRFGDKMDCIARISRPFAPLLTSQDSIIFIKGAYGHTDLGSWPLNDGMFICTFPLHSASSIVGRSRY